MAAERSKDKKEYDRLSKELEGAEPIGPVYARTRKLQQALKAKLGDPPPPQPCPVYLITKPAQGGKTAEITSRLVEEWRNVDDNAIQLVLVDDSIALAQQTSNRMKDVAQEITALLGKNAKKDIVKCWSSRTKETVQSIFGCAKAHKGKVWLVVLANGNKMEKLRELEVLMDEDETLRDLQWNVFLDEADKFSTTDTVNAAIDHFEGNGRLKALYLVSATVAGMFDFDIVKRQGGILVSHLHEAPSLSYQSLKKCQWHYVPLAVTAQDGSAIVNANKRMLEYGVRKKHFSNIDPSSIYLFAPAGFKNDDQDDVAMFMSDNDILEFAALTMNKHGLHLQLPAAGAMDGWPTAKEGHSFAEKLHLARKYADAHHRPLVLIGYQCCKRGNTLQSPDVLFTHAFFDKTPENEAEAYQMVARICTTLSRGPLPVPKIYTTDKNLRRKVLVLEEVAYKLATEYSDKSQPEVLLTKAAYDKVFLEAKSKVEQEIREQAQAQAKGR